MIYKEVNSSSIQPVKKEETSLTSSQIKNYLLDVLSKKGRTYYEIFIKNAVKTPNPLKSLLINLEEHLKTKCDEDDQKAVIKQVFESIKNQLKLLEHIKLKDTNSDEIATIILSVGIAYLDNFLVD